MSQDDRRSSAEADTADEVRPLPSENPHRPVKAERSLLSSRKQLWAAAELLLAGALVVGANVFDVVPITETPWIVLLGWLSLRLRGLRWHTLGLRRPKSWLTTVTVALIAGIGLQIVSEFIHRADR